MLRSIKDLQHHEILATDGGLGSVDEFYFDDEEWTIRYLVVDTGTWLPGRRVLISPIAIQQPDWRGRTLPVSLTREQIKDSPGIDAHKPVSRRQEAALARYYRYPFYWTDSALAGLPPYAATPIPPAQAAEMDRYREEEQARAEAQGDTHLRSTKEVIGYHLEASDGELGHIDDFLVDDSTWAIQYVVVDTSNWWFGKRVLLSTDMIRAVHWLDKKITVDLTREAVRRAPEYDAAAHVDRQWEADYYRHYNRVPYWETPDIRRRVAQAGGRQRLMPRPREQNTAADIPARRKRKP